MGNVNSPEERVTTSSNIQPDVNNKNKKNKIQNKDEIDLLVEQITEKGNELLNQYKENFLDKQLTI